MTHLPALLPYEENVALPTICNSARQTVNQCGDPLEHDRYPLLNPQVA
ncbi:hypothetical protein [Escherichia coli]|nr:hypothetical protein [Escherichia coli]